MFIRLKNRLNMFKEIQIGRYLYLNYFCKSVEHQGKGKIIPYKNAIIDIDRKAKITIGDKNIYIGTNKLKGSKTETYLRIREGAVWSAESGCNISYGSTIEILQNAVLDSGYFTMNSFSVLIAAQEINLGEDVMIGRNVIVYDSDFHSLEKAVPSSKPVHIGNHVWIATNAMVLKGVTIGDGAVIAAGTLVTSNVTERSITAEERKSVVLKDNVDWKR